MGNSYSIYRFSYHTFSDGTTLPINHQRNIIQQYLIFVFFPFHLALLARVCCY